MSKFFHFKGKFNKKIIASTIAALAISCGATHADFNSDDSNSKKTITSMQNSSVMTKNLELEKTNKKPGQILKQDKKELSTDLKSYLKLMKESTENINYDELHKKYVELLNSYTTQEIVLSKENDAITKQLLINKIGIPESNQDLLDITYAFVDSENYFNENSKLKLEIVDSETNKIILSSKMFFINAKHLYEKEELLQDITTDDLNLNYPAIAAKQQKTAGNKFFNSLVMIEADKFKTDHKYNVQIIDEKESRTIAKAELTTDLKQLSHQEKQEWANLYVKCMKKQVDLFKEFIQHH